MLNHEGSHSEYFEELCALAASGQISEPEFVELQDHMKHCAACGSIYIDFIDLLHNKLPLADPELTGSFNRTGFFLRILPTANDFSHGRGNMALQSHPCVRAVPLEASWSFGCGPDAGTPRLPSWLWPCCWRWWRFSVTACAKATRATRRWLLIWQQCTTASARKAALKKVR